MQFINKGTEGCESILFWREILDGGFFFFIRVTKKQKYKNLYFEETNKKKKEKRVKSGLKLF